MNRLLRLVALALLAVLAGAAGSDPGAPSYRIVAKLPHDPNAYTQGLLFAGGVFFESTGLYGRSSLRRVDPKTGHVLQKRDLKPDVFGEGLTLFDDRLIQLTWKAGKAFVYDKQSFELLKEFRYDTEGWGLTHDGRSLIMSDGSEHLYFRNPDTFGIEKVLTVTVNGRPIPLLNELEYIDGEIWANVYQTDFILRISPDSGKVLGWLKLGGIPAAADRNGHEDVLNGIAYNPENHRLFVTGKFYSYIYEIESGP